MSEMLADEVFDIEETRADRPITFEDYERQVQEILEAERAELLVTQAIMNAPPGAEDIALPSRVENRGNVDSVFDELAILEMDEDTDQGTRGNDRNNNNNNCDDEVQFQDDMIANATVSPDLVVDVISGETAGADELNGSGDRIVESNNDEN